MTAAGTVMPLRASRVPLVDVHDLVLLDLDGTVYVGEEPVAGAPAAVRRLLGQGRSVGYLTNNASRTPEAVADQLRRLGVPAEPAQVVTSSQAAAALLAAELPPGAPVLAIGGSGLEVALVAAGLRLVAGADDGPLAVVQGFGPDVAWRHLAEGALAVGRGVPWVATNEDPTLPTPRGVVPGNGSLVGVIRAVTGRRPRVAGKPQRPLVDAARARLAGGSPVVVGDRLDTDVACAESAGLPSLLVLTGVTSPADLLRARLAERPTYVAAGLAGLFAPHPDVVAVGSGLWRCGRWSARVVPAGAAGGGGSASALDLAPDGDAGAAGDGLDGLRAACAAVWTRETGADGVDLSALQQLPGLVR